MAKPKNQLDVIVDAVFRAAAKPKRRKAKGGRRK